ncbi:FYVE zinc finger family protein [Tritrichomonas foetus]|uniref:FYVE zinc finger family protein n=1 Tax=Tritrichomonas foetus TaxID=1144522 RepID=A0A1J4KME0_9EUKA|nr:FYVE zinc finger family protein [Tritrichomonas foetus]|eukprot:OHT10862.1 FYVE zinc finger family protein [Tritrichomonas foetus]
MSNPSQLEKVIQEVYSSEKSYNESVSKCINNITKPLQILHKSGDIRIENPEFLTLFDKYAEIWRLSNGFLEKMNDYILSGKKISILGVFTSFKEDLVAKYFDYIQTYHHLAPIYRKERETNTDLDKFLKTKELIMIDTLPSFLILPIQRPPRYRLLLQEIIKYSDPQSAELTGLKEILNVICKAISDVDQRIEELEEALKFEELQAKISDFEVAKLSRHLLFEGDAAKFSRKTQQNRHIVLFTDCLLVAEPSMMRPLKVNKIYKSGEYNIIAFNDYPPFTNAVDVRQKEKSFRMNMKSPKEKEELIKGFNKVLEISKLTHHDLEMKLFAPVWIPDDLAPNCMVCKSKFTVINRKHHCRYCGKCICRKCFKNKIVLPGLGDDEKNVCTPCFEHITKMYVEHPEVSSEFLAKMMKQTQQSVPIVQQPSVSAPPASTQPSIGRSATLTPSSPPPVAPEATVSQPPSAPPAKSPYSDDDDYPTNPFE